MRAFRLTLVVVVLIVVGCQRHGHQSIPSAGASGAVVIVASLAPVADMVRALTRDTGIEVVNAVPQEYSMDGHSEYFTRHSEAFAFLAASADAVVTVRSAWADDPLFTRARQANIRIVEIDATRPLSGFGAAVPVPRDRDGLPVPFVWRSPGNLSRMAAIVAEDLVHLAPLQAEAIRRNLVRVQTAMFRLRVGYESLFADLPSVDVACLTDQYAALIGELGLHAAVRVPGLESAWTTADETGLARTLRLSPGMVVVCAWEPGGRASAVIEQAQGRWVVLRRYVRDDRRLPLDSLVAWQDGNLSRLAQALADPSFAKGRVP
jgi:ABC-type Zn uptake system ZnuABC Zn-binding protein ZnuA